MLYTYIFDQAAYSQPTGAANISAWWTAFGGRRYGPQAPQAAIDVWTDLGARIYAGSSAGPVHLPATELISSSRT